MKTIGQQKHLLVVIYFLKGTTKTFLETTMIITIDDDESNLGEKIGSTFVSSDTGCTLNFLGGTSEEKHPRLKVLIV